jgi:glycosyltransferase involved in cell wall biosynthesis
MMVLDVVPFGVDLKYFSALNYDRTIDILGVGSLISIKNYTAFIDIIESVAASFPDLNCKIVGEGSQRAGIERLISEKKLQNNIILAGKLEYKSVAEEMLKANILLHTSKFEGQALVITEALAAGLNVVCYPAGIAFSLKSQKLHTGQTKAELIQHLLRLLSEQYQDYSMEVPFTIEGTAIKYTAIYQSNQGA